MFPEHGVAQVRLHPGSAEDVRGPAQGRVVLTMGKAAGRGGKRRLGTSDGHPKRCLAFTICVILVLVSSRQGRPQTSRSHQEVDALLKRAVIEGFGGAV